MKKILKLVFGVSLMTMLFPFAAVAQTTAVPSVTHVIQRGETLQSIAKAYGVSYDLLVSLNPEAKDYIYVGMEIKIPENVVVRQEASSVTASLRANGQSVYSNSETADSHSYQYSSEHPYDNSWSTYGLFYMANFKSADKGAYGLGCEMIGSNGWGGFFCVAANYGIVDPGSIHFRLGPTFGQRVSENVMISCPLTLTITGFSHVSKILKSGNESTDIKTGWGLATMPRIGLRIDKAVLTLGIDINYTFKKNLSTEDQINNLTNKSTYGGKAYVGFCIGIGIFSD